MTLSIVETSGASVSIGADWTYPTRDADGVIRLQPGHFGISDPVHLHAMLDLLKGFSNQSSALRLSLGFGISISRTRVRDGVRRDLYRRIRAYPGSGARPGFAVYCRRAGMGDPFLGKDHNQVAFCVARYLLEVFDLYEPVLITGAGDQSMQTGYLLPFSGG